MDNIDKILLYAETGIRPKAISDDEPTEIYEAVDNLRSDTYRFLSWYTAAYEFRRSKIQRTTQYQTTEDIELEY